MTRLSIGISPNPTVDRGSSNMDNVHLSDLLLATVQSASDTHVALNGPQLSLFLTGAGFTYENDLLTGGTVTRVWLQSGPAVPPSLAFSMTFSNVQVPGNLFIPWLLGDAAQEAFSYLLSGDDDISGSWGNDLIRG